MAWNLLCLFMTFCIFLRVFMFVLLFESANEPAMRKDLTVPTFAESLFYTSYYTKYNTMFFCVGDCVEAGRVGGVVGVCWVRLSWGVGVKVF